MMRVAVIMYDDYGRMLTV